jgi:probable HAF family extracellular repeat protein
MLIRMTRACAPLVAAILLLGVRAGAGDQAVMFTLADSALPSDVGANGGTVVGGFRSGGGFFWMPTSGVVFVGGSSVSAVSRDGRTIVGTAFDSQRRTQAAIWLRGAEWRLLGSVVPNAAPCDDLISSALGASADAKVVVGLAWNGCNFARAFRWEESTGMVDLGSTVPGGSSRANGVSGNGRVVLGWQEHQLGYRLGARWVDGRQTIFTGASEFAVGEAWGANTDGTVIVGQTCRFGDQFDQSAWIWTPAAGVVCLPPPRLRLPLQFLGAAYAVSEDGRVVVGGQSFGLESEAVIWLDRTPYYLKDYLRANGVPNAFEGWINTGSVFGMSRDGRVLVGSGAGPRDFTGYVVILPPLGEAR